MHVDITLERLSRPASVRLVRALTGRVTLDPSLVERIIARSGGTPLGVIEDACRLVASRGRLMQQAVGGGALLAVLASESAIVPPLGDGVSVASANGPQSTVISGAPDAVPGSRGGIGQRGVERAGRRPFGGRSARAAAWK